MGVFLSLMSRTRRGQEVEAHAYQFQPALGQLTFVCVGDE
jgi:hypothetical protein